MKSVRERQMPYGFTHVWNLRNKTNKGKERERSKVRKRLLAIETKLTVTTGGWVGDG